MKPELFRLLDTAFPSYFVLLVTGFMVATVAGVRWAKRIGENPDVVVDLSIAMLLAGVVGARLLHVVADGYFWDYVHLCTDPSLVNWKIEKAQCLSTAYDGVWDSAKGVCHPKSADCFAWARFWAGGLTYYGGLLGATGVAAYQLRRDKFSLWKAADMAAFAVPIGLTFGRLGCLLAGCCFGLRSELPWAMSFPPHSPASDTQFKLAELGSSRMWSHPVHPTQLYESLASLCVAAVCMIWIHPRKRYDGQVFVAFIALYAVARFLIEYLRNDDRGGFLGLSTSQLVGAVLVASAIALHKWRSSVMNNRYVDL